MVNTSPKILLYRVTKNGNVEIQRQRFAEIASLAREAGSSSDRRVHALAGQMIAERAIAAMGAR